MEDKRGDNVCIKGPDGDTRSTAFIKTILVKLIWATSDQLELQHIIRSDLNSPREEEETASRRIKATSYSKGFFSPSYFLQNEHKNESNQNGDKTLTERR